MNARLVKLARAVKAKGLSAKAGINVQSIVADDGMAPRPDGLFLKSDGRKVSLLITTVPLLKACAKRTDMGLKSTEDVAVIFDGEAFSTDVFADDAATFRFAELLVKRRLANAVVKALLLGESQVGVPEGSNALAASVMHGKKVYILWREAAVSGIAVPGMGRVVEEKWQECFAKYLPARKSYSRIVSELRAVVDEVVQQEAGLRRHKSV